MIAESHVNPIRVERLMKKLRNELSEAYRDATGNPDDPVLSHLAQAFDHLHIVWLHLREEKRSAGPGSEDPH